MTTTKSFEDLSEDEANAVIRRIINTARSDDELRDGLVAAGFDGASAAIHSDTHGSSYMAMVMVHGPGGEIITGRPAR